MNRLTIFALLLFMLPARAALAQEAVCDPPAAGAASSCGIDPAGKPGGDIQWVTVTSGMFEMGSRFGDTDELPVHQVVISGFLMAATEVTVAQYRRCVQAGACTLPASNPECTYGIKDRDDFPVNCVDWEQAQAYSKWVGGRLPTEAEWEYAARYGRNTVKGREYVMTVEDFSKPKKGVLRNFSEIDAFAWYRGNSGEVMHPVAAKMPTDLGLYDMLGNLMEWVADWLGPYKAGPLVVNPQGADIGYLKVLRGGGLASHGDRVRAAVREHADPDTQGVYVGFRPIRPITAK